MVATRKETRVVEIRIDSKEFKRATREVNKNLRDIRKEASRTSSIFRDMFTFLAAGQVTQWARDLVGGLAEIERLDTIMMGATKTQELFGESMDFVRGLAEDYGLSMRGLQEGYAHVIAAGRGLGLDNQVIQESFEGLTVAAAAFRVEGVELQLMLQGARQLMGSATVNMEDLRQVTERLPNGMHAATRALQELTGDMDINQQTLKKMVSEGKVATEDFFPEFTKQLKEMNFEAASKGAETFTAAITRVSNAFDEMRRSDAAQWFLDVLAESAEFIADLAGGQTVTQATANIQGLNESIADTVELNIALIEAQDELNSYQESWIAGLQEGSEAYENAIRQRRERIEQIQWEIDSIIALNAVERENARIMRESAEAVAQNRRLRAEQDEGLTGMPWIPTTSGGTSAFTVPGADATAHVEAYGREAEELERLRRAAMDLQAAWDPLYVLQTQMTDGMNLLADAHARGAITMTENMELGNEFTEHMLKQLEELEGGTEKVSETAEQLGASFANAFADAILSADNFMDVLNSLEQQLLSVMTNLLVTQPLTSFLTSTLGTFIPGLADGGTVMPGQPYVVGERGPELMIPSTSGNVVPNHELGGQTIIINFTGSVSGEGLRQNATQIAAQIGAQTARATKRLS